jgi:Holliday junction resolvase
MSQRPELQWLFGTTLNERLEFEVHNRNVFWSRLVRLLQSDPAAERVWAGYIAAYRDTLFNPQDAPSKVRSDIVIRASDFDGELLDAFSEWIACVKLSQLGFDSFRVVVPPANVKKAPPTPDFLAIHDGEHAAIEVKNLRAHECVESVMPDIFYDEKLKGLPFAGLRLVVLRSFRGSLNDDEKQRLRTIVRNLSAYPMSQVCRERLSARAEAVFKIIPGNGTAMCSDFIGLSDLDRDVDAYAGLLNKIRLNARKALIQLHSPLAKPAKTRVVAMRWDVPFVSMPWPATLTDAVLGVFTDAQREVGLTAHVHVFTDHDYVLASTLS